MHTLNNRPRENLSSPPSEQNSQCLRINLVISFASRCADTLFLLCLKSAKRLGSRENISNLPSNVEVFPRETVSKWLERKIAHRMRQNLGLIYSLLLAMWDGVSKLYTRVVGKDLTISILDPI